MEVSTTKSDEIKPLKPLDTMEQPNQLGNLSNLFNDVNFLYPTSIIPSGSPKLTFQMIKLYVNGATKRLYIYDIQADSWYYTALT